MTVTRIRPTGRDALGDPIAGDPDELDLPGAFVAPRSSSGVDDRGRAGAIVGLSLYAPGGTEAARLIRAGDLVRTDLVRSDGTVFTIEGEIGIWTSPYGSGADGVEVALRRGEG